MVHFKAIADDLGIKVTKLRKGSPLRLRINHIVVKKEIITYIVF